MNPLTYVMINLAVVCDLKYWGGADPSWKYAAGRCGSPCELYEPDSDRAGQAGKPDHSGDKSNGVCRACASVLNVEPEMEFSCPENNAKNRKTGTSDEEVAFDHVSFTYGGAGAETLSNIHFTVKKDRPWVSSAEPEAENPRWSICWHVFMMQRTDRSASAVTISEAIQEKSCVAMNWYGHAKSTAVFGTIRSNLLWGNPGATDEMLLAALETAQAAEFVQKKEKQLDEPVEQGGRNLSGGQKQRLTVCPCSGGRSGDSDPG